MAIQTKDTLKSYFGAGARPTAAQFEDLIDSVLSLRADGTVSVTDDNTVIDVAINHDLSIGHDLTVTGNSLIGNALAVNTSSVPDDGATKLFVDGLTHVTGRIVSDTGIYSYGDILALDAGLTVQNTGENGLGFFVVNGGDVRVGTSGYNITTYTHPSLQIAVPIRYMGDEDCIMYHRNTPPDDDFTGRGFRMRYNSNNDLVFEKTDHNNVEPLGSILFTNTGTDIVSGGTLLPESVALAIHGNNTVGINYDGDTGSHHLYVDGTAAKTSGGGWVNASDRRLKKEITPFEDSLELLKKVMPIWFRYNNKGGIKNTDKNVGVIAQDIQEIFPYMVSGYQGKLNESDEETTELLNFNGGALRYVIINAIKELDERLATLETKAVGKV